jgi:hypothetical protein
MRYLATKAGTAHVVVKDSACPVVKRNAEAWKGQRSLKPDVVLKSYKDCAKCETFKHAKAEAVPPVRRHRESPVSKVRKAERGLIDSVPPRLRKAGENLRTKKPTAKKEPVAPKARNVTAQVKSPNWPVADERTTQKVKEHIGIAEEHGWSTEVTANERRGLTLTATRGEEACVLAYRENGILWNDEIVFKVPGRTVPMHNSGTWRRQVSLPEGKRPIPARPKRFGRKAVVKVANGPEGAEESATEPTEGSPEEEIPLNKSSLPFTHDADDIVIIDHIKGRTLYWRNNMMAKVVSARVPSKARLIRFGATKQGRRFVSFPESTMTKDGEMWGAERSVAIEDMLRVR